MTGWRQAVFVRQRRIDVIQRALSKILDEEAWSPATPRRLRVGSADASSRGWTMIAPELASFFLDRGGVQEPRLCRLARELRCPAYELDARGSGATTLFEVDPTGRMRISGAPVSLLARLAGIADGDAELTALEVETDVVGFGLLPMPDEIRDRIAALRDGPPLALADYLGALAGFPAWTRHGDDAVAAGELVYEPPPIVIRANGRASISGTAMTTLMVLRPETREASARGTPRAALSSPDRRGRRPRSAARPRR